MENNMEKVVDLKETSGRYVLEESRDYHYILDTKTFLDRLTQLCEGVSDENGIIEIPAQAVKDFKDKCREAEAVDDTLAPDWEKIRLAVVDMFDLSPEMTVAEVFGFYKEDENHIYTTV